jgi:hypothetical protein
MSMTCSICASPDRAEVERLLVSGRSMRSIAVQYGLSSTSLGRHRNNGHVPAAIMVAEQDDREAHAIDLAGRVEYLWRKASAILEQAEADGRATIALSAVRELRATVELLARLSGALELQEHGEVSIQLSFGDGRTALPIPGLVPGKVIDVNDRGPKGAS